MMMTYTTCFKLSKYRNVFWGIGVVLEESRAWLRKKLISLLISLSIWLRPPTPPAKRQQYQHFGFPQKMFWHKTWTLHWHHMIYHDYLMLSTIVKLSCWSFITSAIIVYLLHCALITNNYTVPHYIFPHCNCNSHIAIVIVIVMVETEDNCGHCCLHNISIICYFPGGLHGDCQAGGRGGGRWWWGYQGVPGGNITEELSEAAVLHCPDNGIW